MRRCASGPGTSVDPAVLGAALLLSFSLAPVAPVQAGTTVDTLASAILSPASSLEGGSLIGPPESRATWFFVGGIQPRDGAALVALSTGNLQTPPVPGTDLAAVGPTDDIAGVNFTLRVPEDARSLRLSYRILSPHWDAGDPSLLDEANFHIQGESVALDPVALGPLRPAALPLFPATEAELAGTAFEGGVGGGTGWLEAVVPVAPGTQIAVRLAVVDGGDSAGGDLVLLVDALRFDPGIPSGLRPGWAPRLEAVSPSRLPPGSSQSLELRGQRLVPGAGVALWSLVDGSRATVHSFDATEVEEISSERALLSLPPLEEGRYGLEVTWDQGSLWWPNLLEIDRRRPVLSSLQPDVGPPAGGGLSTLQGEDLIEIHALYLGGTEVSEWSSHSPGRLDFVVPAGVSGPADLLVITAGGTGDLEAGYWYTEADPTEGEEEAAAGTAPGDCSVAGGRPNAGLWAGGILLLGGTLRRRLLRPA